MRQLHRLTAAAGFLALVAVVQADTILRQSSFDLSRAEDPTYFQNWKTQVEGIGTDAEGLTSAQLYFPVQKANLGRTSTTSSQDWSAYNILAVKLTNRESFPCEFRALVYLTASPNDGANMFSGKIVIGPNETRRFLCYLNPDDAMPYGLEYMRPVLSAAYNNVYSSGRFRDLRTIYHWRFSYQGTAPARVDVSDLRLIKQDITFQGMVDKFGQYNDRDWSSRIRTEDDLQVHKAAEQTDLAENPGMGEQLGTDKVANDNPQPGKWAIVTQNNGRKYFQHPNGKLLWALGVSAIHGGTPTPVGGRENYFQEIPSTSGRFASCFYIRPTLDGNNTCYSFHQQNLISKYGENYMPTWTNLVKDRMSSWGLNMLGIQCLGQFYDNTIPHTQLLTTQNFPTRLRVPQQLWGSFPDPYDPSFQSWMATNFAAGLARYNNQTNFVGVYVDNELSWGNTFSDKARYNVELGTLKAPATQPAKIAFVNWLSTRYRGSIAALNTAWGTSFSSFNDILVGAFQPTIFPERMALDFKLWTRLFAGTYYGAVRGALTQAGLSGLYLGSRYADWLPEVVEPADNYVDVHSFNFYRTAGYVNWNYFALRKKPFMFSEFGHSVQADGTFGGPGEVYSQDERAFNMQRTLGVALNFNNCVGAILYCYTDQPVTGRYTDYENSGLGLVDIADTPHYETVNAIRSVARTMYTTRG